MSPVCTNATRTVCPPTGADPSQYQIGPTPTHATAHAAATQRPYPSRPRIRHATAVFTAATRKLVNATPPSAADANVIGAFHCDNPSGAHGPPNAGKDRTASAATHALGNTGTAAKDGPANSR